ncbi:putative multi antimicrobial extrusion protein [Lupinus albus]|uniref:Protein DETOXIFICATION n=1 Tax=Lupinus albus TaxID=3870 RepID=A0A6A4Q0X9_LUPAL|nr:putative multi antimicrobial extrusion protein [Lupinus albus]
MHQKLSKQNMCKLLSSSSISHESNEDNPNTSIINVEDNSNLLTPLIHKPSSSEPEIQNPNKINFSIYLSETKCIANIALPMILSGILLYARSMISMIFLGHLGDLALAGGSLAIGFANITGYSILSGLANGMEPICGQAFGANRFNLLGLVMQRMVLLLLLTSVFISFLWINMKKILIFFGQEKDIASEAQFYLIYCIPDLIIQSLLHPLRIYLRSQSITLPLTYCAALSIILHLPINYLLVIVLKLGTKGVALAVIWTHFNVVASLIMYIIISGVHSKTWGGFSYACFKGWKVLLNLAIPSCISVCLEWWWYEIMILLCGLLANPNASVASMGVLIQTTSLIYIFPHSLSFGVSTRVGNELGAENPQRAKLAARIGVCFSFLLGVLALGFTFSVRNVWSTMFTNDAKIITLTSTVLPIVGACELGNCPQTTVCGVLRGTARPKFGANINLGCFYLVGMPIAVWLSFFAGFDFKGLWLGLLAAQFSCMITMLFVLARTDWEGQAQRAKELTSCDANEEAKLEE